MKFATHRQTLSVIKLGGLAMNAASQTRAISEKATESMRHAHCKPGLTSEQQDAEFRSAGVAKARTSLSAHLKHFKAAAEMRQNHLVIGVGEPCSPAVALRAQVDETVRLLREEGFAVEEEPVVEQVYGTNSVLATATPKTGANLRVMW
ncbi:hypothetical protein HN018_13090 [Lichenicola cladoniae]|uniref:Uncharacterized protein n=1 Tax=Lichenicola cladoniae TaxID=1484109 RepID=A0A6M8HR79_9PROT|nr:hypothetical protein [Lichenicola cladoniae]NPD68719.1 hypothetical protein [Acetobacteraceae bacterium]QKE90848.1 hypothetical protein HN018_13090 [Lichenicola cladoniae]